MTDPVIDTTDWESLGATWKSGGDHPAIVPALLRQRVESATRRMRWWLVGEIALTFVALGFSVWMLIPRASAYGLLIASDIWIVTAIVWAFALVSRRGLWRPLSATTDAYLALARARVVRRMWNVGFALLLLVAQTGTVFFVDSFGRARGGAMGRTIALLGLGAWVVWVVWELRRARNELRYLDELRSGLTGR